MKYLNQLNNEILMILNHIIPINDINQKILFFKKKIEEDEILDYHKKRYNEITTLYFNSFEYDLWGRRIPYSYVINDCERWKIEKDRKMEFYNYTGISFQIRDMLIEILDCQDDLTIKNVDQSCYRDDYKEWREMDDHLYSFLAKKIIDEFKFELN
tara:strand:- start:295 stop:762 length:468 start_codon:yes stop_codon:yes gene_type:complete